MKELINISGQQFYHSAIDQLIERCSQNEKCAIIIDEDHLDELLKKAIDIIGKNVNQIIIISDTINKALEPLIDKDVLLLATNSFEHGTRLAMLGSALSKTVICVLDEDTEKLKEIIKGVEV